METRAIRQEMLVSEDGVLRLEEMTPGESVEVIVLRLDPPLDAPAESRWGWAKGKVVVHDDFEDPLPEMEPYL